MVTKLPPKTIISLVITILIIIVLFAIISPIFTGPEIRAWDQLGDEIEIVCASPAGTTRQLNIFLPDSAGSTKLNLVFFYMSILDLRNSPLARTVPEQFREPYPKLVVARRTFGVERNDYLIGFYEWVLQKPGNKELRKPRDLKECQSRNIRVCGIVSGVEKCDSYAFESEEGKESLTFTIRKESPTKVLLSYTGDTICGDDRCCPPENDTKAPSYCEADCKDEKACKPFTES